MRSLLHDICHGLRIFARSPGFAAATVITLALGIGANTAVFSIFSALTLRELPVWRPERLVQLSGVYRNGARVPFSFPMFLEIEREQRVFSGLFGWTGSATFTVEADRTLSLTDVRAVSGNYYSELGVAPLLGRLIGLEDVGGTTGSQVAVIGYEFWERRFGRDPAVIGKTIRIEGQHFTIVGVTRRWFAGMTPGKPPEITVPITAAPLIRGDVRKTMGGRSVLWVSVTGRLRDGVTVEHARAQLQSLWPAVLAATVPTQSPGRRRQSFLSMGLEVQPAATGFNADLRSQFIRPLYVLMVVVGLILLIACVNLANLALARAAARSQEISVRAALGASRLRIARQLITESVLLSGCGALLALALAYWCSRFLVSLMAEGTLTPIILDLRPDWRVLSYTTLAAVLTGLLIGLVPARQIAVEEPASALRRNGCTLSRGTGKLGKALIVIQIALSLVLLQGAGLLLRTFHRLWSFNPGFHKAGVLQVSLYPTPQGYGNLDMNSYLSQLMERVHSIPGVHSVGFSNLPVPAGGRGGWRDTVSLMAADPDPNGSLLATLAAVSPGFFETLGIPLVRGRDFDWGDDEGHPRCAIVDGNLARRLLPSGDVVGQRIRFGVQPEFQDLEIVGVARSARVVDLRDGNRLVVYVPCLQHRQYGQHGNLFVRANDPGAFARAVADEVQSLGREYATGAKTVEQMSEQTLLEERAIAMLSSFFAAMALLLAGTGLFGLTSYAISRRTREIGIRLALGSQRRGILRMILRETLLLTAAGIGIGLPCALAATRLIAHMLFGVSPHDPLTLATASGALIAIGATAGYLAARRAMKVDPMVALRYE